jgi:hypothetical protein
MDELWTSLRAGRARRSTSGERECRLTGVGSAGLVDGSSSMRFTGTNGGNVSMSRPLQRETYSDQ